MTALTLLLVVDDERALPSSDMHTALKAVQATPGRTVRVHVTHDVDEAVRARRPDVVIIDLDARTFDSWALLDTLKREPRTRAIPVVVFSVDDGEARVARAYQAYANAFVHRAENAAEWQRVLQRVVTFWAGGLVRLPGAFEPPDG